MNVVNQGGEPRTFAAVNHFGGGLMAEPNTHEEIVSECANGLNIALAGMRILQSSSVNLSGPSKAENLFQCCIHPWIRLRVEVE